MDVAEQYSAGSGGRREEGEEEGVVCSRRVCAPVMFMQGMTHAGDRDERAGAVCR